MKKDNLVSNEIARLIDKRIEELRLYTRKTEKEVLELIKDSMEIRNNEWKIWTKNSIIDFYKTSQGVMYCLSKWNSEEKYQNIIDYITKICTKKGGKILDFGGGIGELTISLKENNLDVDFLELQSRTLEFAKWRFRKKGFTLNIYTNLDDIFSKYDIVICLDVLETLVNPQEYLKKFQSLLKPDGLLILSIGEVGSKFHPMNLIENKEFLDNIDIHCKELGLQESYFENKFHLKIKKFIT